jgi:hypothetical protein
MRVAAAAWAGKVLIRRSTLIPAKPQGTQKNVGAGCANARTLCKRFAVSQPQTGFTMGEKNVQKK